MSQRHNSPLHTKATAATCGDSRASLTRARPAALEHGSQVDRRPGTDALRVATLLEQPANLAHRELDAGLCGTVSKSRAPPQQRTMPNQYQPFDHSVSNSAHRALLDLGAAALAAGAFLALALDSTTALALTRHVSKSLHADEPNSVPFFCRVHEWKARLALPVSHPCRLRLKNPVKNARFPGASRAQPTLKTAHTRPSSPTKIRGPQSHSAKANDCATPVAMMRIRFTLQAIQKSQPGSSNLARLPAAESHAAMDRSADGFCHLWRSTSGPGASASGLWSCEND